MFKIESYIYLFSPIINIASLYVHGILSQAKQLQVKRDRAEAREKIKLAKLFIYSSYAVGFAVLVVAATIVGVIFHRLHLQFKS